MGDHAYRVEPSTRFSILSSGVVLSSHSSRTQGVKFSAAGALLEAPEIYHKRTVDDNDIFAHLCVNPGSGKATKP